VQARRPSLAGYSSIHTVGAAAAGVAGRLAVTRCALPDQGVETTSQQEDGQSPLVRKLRLNGRCL